MKHFEMKVCLTCALLVLSSVEGLVASTFLGAQEPVDYVNPFVGTSNYGACHPGAVCPQGLMSVSPFNVMGFATDNKYEKDQRWWSTPYEATNKYLTGFSHVNLSGVGCPDMAALLVLPTSGNLNVDYAHYGSTYSREEAAAGYYANTLDKYGIRCEATATLRTSRLRFSFPGGQSNILLNLGEGLTNESGATVRFVNDREVEGSKLLGTFCYNAQAVFPIYFVMRINKLPASRGYWKKMRDTADWEKDWDKDAGQYKLYTHYSKELSGDDIGAWFSFVGSDQETVEVSIGVSFVSIENARLNLDKEQPYGISFDQLRDNARRLWNDDLSRIQVKGGTDEQKRIFYTAFYHTLIHPNLLQDVSGHYPQMEGDKVMSAHRNRYTVFSLWDTCRNLHQLLTLVFPDRQLDIIHTFLDMYHETGWLPRWELYGRETLTMEGDPAIPIIVDTWMKGLRDFNTQAAWKAMRKSAFGETRDNKLRPDIQDYLQYGYVPLRSENDNSVSHALEYYVADYALSTWADAFENKETAKQLRERAQGYRKYYNQQVGTLCPLLPNGKFLTPFNPEQGKNFEPVPGFHEGSAWNYTFYVPFDIPGLAKLMGGDDQFVRKLQAVFDNGQFDPCNEPDLAYPYLFSQIKGEEWRTQKLVKYLLAKHFTNTPGGLPGNDDTGTMSAWALFSMMGLYPDCPGVPHYTVTTPVFDEIVIQLDKKYWDRDQLVIRKEGQGDYIHEIRLGKKKSGYLIDHRALIKAGELTIQTTMTH